MWTPPSNLNLDLIRFAGCGLVGRPVLARDDDIAVLIDQPHFASAATDFALDVLVQNLPGHRHFQVRVDATEGGPRCLSVLQGAFTSCYNCNKSG